MFSDIGIWVLSHTSMISSGSAVLYFNFTFLLNRPPFCRLMNLAPAKESRLFWGSHAFDAVVGKR